MVRQGKGGGIERGGGGRRLAVKLRTAKGRKTASTRWLQRQLNDPYVAEAKSKGYRSRAAFKLIEIDDKQRILRPGMTVLDLGAAPGGWSQIAAERVGSGVGQGQVIAVDLTPIEPLPGVEVLTLDITEPDALDRIREALKGGRADVVLSDMAAPTTGHQQTVHLRTTYLCEVAADFALTVLKPGGHFLSKVFRGGAESAVLTTLKQNFATVHHIKPPASRAGSVELFILAKGFKGRKPATAVDEEAPDGDDEAAWQP